MPIFNGGRIGSNNVPFTGTKSDDPNYSSVSLLLNGNGTNGSTTFTDSSSYGHTVTPAGNAQISTTQSKFGGASMYFDGSGDYLSIPSSNSFNFGSGDFTVEFWIYFNNLSGFKNIINKRSNTSSFQWIWFSTFDNSLVVYITSNGSSWDIASNLNFGIVTTGQWYHIALVRNGTEIACYVNGTKSANTATTSSSINFGSENLLVGGDVSLYQTNGYIDDLRITKGVARYTSNFTPPTAQLPGAETGTFASGLWTGLEQCDAVRREIWTGLVPSIVTDGLVLHLDAGDSASYPGSGTTWTDLSGNGNNGTLVNGVGYTSSNGGALTFDGSSDYVIINKTNISNFGLSPFTVEMWVYKNVNGQFALYDPRPSGNGNYFTILIDSDNLIKVIHTGAIRYSSTQSTNLLSWYNIVISREGTGTNQTYLYINGNLDSIHTDSINYTDARLVIGAAAFSPLGAASLDGRISTVRTYNKALTASEITQNFDALKGRYGL